MVTLPASLPNTSSTSTRQNDLSNGSLAISMSSRVARWGYHGLDTEPRLFRSPGLFLERGCPLQAIDFAQRGQRPQAICCVAPNYEFRFGGTFFHAGCPSGWPPQEPAILS